MAAHAIYTSTLAGITAQCLLVEARVAQGLPCFEVVGLPDRLSKECRIRVRSALLSCSWPLPAKQILVNVTPAELGRSVVSCDLAISIALLSSLGKVPYPQRPSLFIGELSLDGELRPARGVLAQLHRAKQQGITEVILPAANLPEAGLASEELHIVGAKHLADVVHYLLGDHSLPSASRSDFESEPDEPHTCISEISGQATAKRALELAAAGGHHVLFEGPPGAGKTMLARRLPGLLPPPTAAEHLQMATIASAAGATFNGTRPFRSPHHTASAAALVGGGDPIRPGEVTLAHGGVLFLDEFPEFRRDVIESLRTIMERGEVAVARARSREVMPAASLVVAAMNPCPCGLSGDTERTCTCPPGRVAQYRSRLSGPLLERFDLYVRLSRVPARELHAAAQEGPTSAMIRERVAAIRRRRNVTPSAARDLALQATSSALELLENAVDKLGMSGRGFVRTLRVASTIRDLEGQDKISTQHVAEALHFRHRDPERL